MKDDVFWYLLGRYGEMGLGERPLPPQQAPAPAFPVQYLPFGLVHFESKAEKDRACNADRVIGVAPSLSPDNPARRYRPPVVRTCGAIVRARGP